MTAFSFLLLTFCRGSPFDDLHWKPEGKRVIAVVLKDYQVTTSWRMVDSGSRSVKRRYTAHCCLVYLVPHTMLQGHLCHAPYLPVQSFSTVYVCVGVELLSPRHGDFSLHCILPCCFPKWLYFHQLCMGVLFPVSSPALDILFLSKW